MSELERITELLKRHSWLEDLTEPPAICQHNHKASGTGAVFLDSQGILFCNECRGFQIIKRKLT